MGWADLWLLVEGKRKHTHLRLFPLCHLDASAWECPLALGESLEVEAKEVEPGLHQPRDIEMPLLPSLLHTIGAFLAMVE